METSKYLFYFYSFLFSDFFCYQFFRHKYIVFFVLICNHCSSSSDNLPLLLSAFRGGNPTHLNKLFVTGTNIHKSCSNNGSKSRRSFSWTNLLPKLFIIPLLNYDSDLADSFIFTARFRFCMITNTLKSISFSNDCAMDEKFKRVKPFIYCVAD